MSDFPRLADVSPPEASPHALLRYSLTLLSRRDSHTVISRNPGPLRIADLAGHLDDRVDPSQVPSQTRLLPTISRARSDTTHDTVDPTNGSRVGLNYSPRHAQYPL